MKKASKPRSRGTLLFAAICWTVCTLIWSLTILLHTLRGNDTSLLILQIFVLALSALNAVLNWLRWASYPKHHPSNTQEE